MKKMVFALACLLFFTLSSGGAGETVTGLVDRFKNATGVEREEIRRLAGGRMIYGSGIITDVRDSRFFNDLEKLDRSYYTVETAPQETPEGNAYQIIFLYEDISSVEALRRGERTEASGPLLKIAGKGLWIYIWIGAG